MNKPDRLVLIGMMGSGKSTLAALVAERVGVEWVDSDAELERRSGRTIAEMFGEEGEAGFRRREREVVASVLDRTPPVVVSLGGGAVLDPTLRSQAPAAGLVVWLRATVDTLLARIPDRASRPLLAADPIGAMTRLLAERSPLYEEAADVAIEVDGKTPDAVADELLDVARGHGVFVGTAR